jgi:hypothetical protein
MHSTLYSEHGYAIYTKLIASLALQNKCISTLIHSFELADVHGLLLMFCEMLSNIHPLVKTYTAEGGA